MYRQQQEKMAAEVALQQQFIPRLVSLPIVNSAIGQVSNMYEKTKESNRLFKYTLETAEVGVKTVASTAQPVVNKFEKPIGTLNSFACNQLDKLEQSLPIITKSTDVVYANTLKPTVDRVAAVTQYGTDKVNCVKTLTTSTIDGVKNYTTDTITGVKNYTTGTIGGAKQYSVDKLTEAKNYSTEKMTVALDSPYGKMVTDQVDKVLKSTEGYLDYYFPAAENSDEKEPKIAPDAPTLTRLSNLSVKTRRRMYSRAMRELQNAQLRSRETLDKLTHTVDLIQYAKTNIDSVTGHMTDKVSAVGGKVQFYWEEINKTDEEVEIEMEALAANTEEAKKENQVTTTYELERRLLATARHLTLHLKGGLSMISGHVVVLPKNMQDQFTTARNFVEEMYTNFSTATGLHDLPMRLVDQAKERLGYIQETFTHMTDYISSSRAVTWLVPDFDVNPTDMFTDYETEEDDDGQVNYVPCQDTKPCNIPLGQGKCAQ